MTHANDTILQEWFLTTSDALGEYVLLGPFVNDEGQALEMIPSLEHALLKLNPNAGDYKIVAKNLTNNNSLVSYKGVMNEHFNMV